MASPAIRPCCDVIRELMDAIAREDWTEVKNILSESSPHVADSVVTQLINEDRWNAVRQIIECVEDEDRTWNIDGIVVKSSILLSIANRYWTYLNESPSERFTDTMFQWIIRQVCTRATEREVFQFVLVYCADDRLDFVLTILVERRQWKAVGQVLVRGVSDSMNQWAVRETCKHCKNKDFGTFDFRSSVSYLRWNQRDHVTVEHFLIRDILPHCAKDQLNSVLTTLVERRLWQAVGGMLRKGVSDSNKQWAVQEACKHCEGYEVESLIQNILPHCADDQLGSMLTTLVERRLWHAVLYVLERGVGDSSKRWVVLEVCACCESVSQEQKLSDILLFCADDQVDCVLTTLVARHLWRAVGEMLKKGVSDSNKQWAVQEACNNCKQYYVGTVLTRSRLLLDQEYDLSVEQLLVQNILPHCTDDRLGSVLTTLVERRLWEAVLYVLERGVSDSSKRWVVFEVCACCESGVQEQVLSDILLFCADHNADFVLTTLVKRCHWSDRGEMLNLVAELLKQGVSETLGTWVVEEARKRAKNDGFVKYVLPHCSLSHLNSAIPDLVKQGKITVVNIVMRRILIDMNTESFVLPRWYVDVLPLFVELGLWNYVQEILHSVVMKSLYHWTKREGDVTEDDSVLWAIVNTCRVNATCAVRLFKAVEEKTASIVGKLHKRLGLTEDLCELLYTSFLDQVCVALCSEGRDTKIMSDSLPCHVRDIYTVITSCLQTINTNSVEGMVSHFKRESRIMTFSGKLSSVSAHHFLMFLKQFNLYCTCKRGDDDDEVLLMMFAVLTLSTVLQSMALRIMLRHKRWDVISQADLSGVWEQDRRHLLQAAVKQRQWSVVKRWADHTLYDDQRIWALNEALNEKQWDVALLLADHGLTDIDLMRVHYRLAKYADWDVILNMFERGADVEEVKQRLGRMKDNKRISEMSQRYIIDRHIQVKTLENTIQKKKVCTLENACRECNWSFVLYTLLRNPSKASVLFAMKVATKNKAWHVVMQLVRLGMDAKQRHSLFSRMMKREQWGVCRVLLEQGLRVQLCMKVLPHLMEMNQWTLVARVMEYDVGDDVRQQVMQRAWERREGSVVWLCIKSLPTPLSVEEREAMFQRAFSCELWQVIKPLVEEKDETGIRHRDIALLEAIDLHEWDLVDHCQRHHADINMKDDDGHTPLQRAAMKKDWEAVEELVVRDGDPNQLDSKGYTVLHWVLTAKQWSVVKLLIKYQADIHKKQKGLNGEPGVTPLGMLIDARRSDIIDHSLFWCPDQSKGMNNIFETALHAACLSGCYDSIYNLVARGVNPLAVTKKGQSVLAYALQNEDCPQRMVAECIRLGFSTHQPNLTNIVEDLKFLIFGYYYDRDVWPPKREFTSPFLCALLRGLPVVVQMLCESGACSQRELFRLFAQLPGLADPNTVMGRTLQEQRGHDVVAYQHFVYCIENIALPHLTEIATTPRSLVSTCRLVISHCLTLSKTRHRDVDQLPLTERMKNFVLFSDLTDPDFGKDTT